MLQGAQHIARIGPHGQRIIDLGVCEFGSFSVLPPPNGVAVTTLLAPHSDPNAPHTHSPLQQPPAALGGAAADAGGMDNESEAQVVVWVKMVPTDVGR